MATLQGLEAILSDNLSGEITAADMRKVVGSLWAHNEVTRQIAIARGLPAGGQGGDALFKGEGSASQWSTLPVTTGEPVPTLAILFENGLI